MSNETEEFEFAEEPDVADIDAEMTPEAISSAVVFMTDWTIETIRSQMKKGNIDIGPRFQRRDAWQLERKSRYIESLMLQLPVPHIVLAEMKDVKGRFIVLDGKQRLLTVKQFFGDALGSKNNLFSLKGLEILRNLEGHSITDIGDHYGLENTTVRSVVVRNWPNIAFLHLLFKRLNTESVKLNAQELRQAAFSGEFVDFADDASSKSTGLRKVLKLKPQECDPRMRDVEFLVRYFAHKNCFSLFRGPMKSFLDDACDELNKKWLDIKDVLSEQLVHFEGAIELGYTVFGEHFGKKWDSSAGQYSDRINRAVLEVLVFYFSQVNFAAEALERAHEVEELFKSTSTASGAFITAIDATPKHQKKSQERFFAWGQALKEQGFTVEFPPRSEFE